MSFLTTKKFAWLGLGVSLALLLVFTMAGTSLGRQLLPSLIHEPIASFKTRLLRNMGLLQTVEQSQRQKKESDRAMSSDGPKENQYRIDVTATKVVKKRLKKTLHRSGTFSQYEELKLSTTRAGRVKELFIQEAGETVTANQTVALLERRGLKIDKRQARSKENERKINVSIVQAQLSELRTRLMQAQSRYRSQLESLRYVQQRYRSNLGLFKIGAITEQKLLTIAQERFNAITKLLSARLQINQLKKNNDRLRHKVNLARARVNQAGLAVQKIQNKLRKTIVRAPESGVISSMNISEGEILDRGGKTLMTLMNLDRIYLEVQVPELDVSKVFPGQTVKVTADAYPAITLTGTVDNINPVVNPKSRSLTVKVLLDNPDRKLKPGMFGKAKFIVSQTDKVTVVPREAIMFSPGGDERQVRIFVVQNGIAVSRDVTLAGGNERFARIKQGLKPGETVVVNGQDRLKDFAEVDVKMIPSGKDPQSGDNY